MLISVHPMHATLLPPYVPSNWTQVSDSSFGTSNIFSVTSNGLGQYVAVGGQGKLATSTNSTEWQQRAVGLGDIDLYAVAYGDEKYIIGGASGNMATSSDGVLWSTVANSSFGASPILSINYFTSQQIWLAVGGSGALATSENGISWTRRTSTFGNSFINKVYSAGDIAIAVGFNGLLATSINGTEWIGRSSSFNVDTIYSASSDPFVPYRYVAVGTSGKIAYSDNGTSWNQILPSASFNQSTIRAVAGNEEGFVAAGASGRLATSFNRESWTQRVSSFSLTTINDLFISEQLAIAVGNSGKIGFSN